MKHIIQLVIIAFVTTSCLSTARLSDFPSSSEHIPFEKLKTKEYETRSLEWTFDFEDGKDYNVIVQGKNELETIELITKALKSYGYKIIKSDNAEKRVIGKRGLRAHEWKSICVAYYHISGNETQVYIMNKVTQDITGGSQYNRAEEIGLAICEMSNACVSE